VNQRDHVRLRNIDGGLDAFLEYRTVKAPASEEGYSENDALWVWDDAQSMGVIFWLGHSGNQYPQAVERVTVFLPDGSLLMKSEVGEQSTDESPAGPGLVIHCDEPFKKWSYRYAGPAKLTSQAELRSGPIPPGAESISVSIEATATMLAPPWVQGAFTESREEWRETPAAHFHGGYRYEQLLNAEVTLHLGEGDHDSYRLSCLGMRTHRKGTRILGKGPDGTERFPGHIWMDAIFPSGRAFYVMRPGGTNGIAVEGGDAWVRQDDTFYRAEVRQPPYFKPTIRGEEHFTFQLESELGVDKIEGEIVANCINTMGVEPPSGIGVDWDTKVPGALALSQGFARYRWRGEVATNMIERSLPIAGLTRP
jgi:hypothetical protein